MHSMAPGDLSDDALMLRYAQGDVGAFEELYARYERRLYGFCFRYLGEPDAAADAFQEVFKRVVDARRAYRPRGRFGSWLFTLARRVCIDDYRGRRRRESASLAGHGGVEAGEDVRGSTQRLFLQDELRRLLARVTPEQREALLLARYYGFTYAEIARMTGSTEAAVKQRVYRALQALRALREPGDLAQPGGREA